MAFSWHQSIKATSGPPREYTCKSRGDRVPKFKIFLLAIRIKSRVPSIILTAANILANSTKRNSALGIIRSKTKLWDRCFAPGRTKSKRCKNWASF